MAAREKGGRVIFIGNIPYGFTEEQICTLFGQAGRVVSFRLVYDKETSKPKGFGFLEYETPEAAATAVRNLNDKEVNGRTLRVDYSNDNDKGGKTGQDGAQALPGGGTSLPAFPPGAEIAPGVTAPDAISKTVSQLPAPQLLDILSQMKNLVASEPAKAQAILQQAPQLAYALFQALLLLGLVDTNILASLVATTTQAPVPPPQQPPPQFQQQMPAGFVPMQQPQYNNGYPPQNYATPPPVQASQPPPPVQQPPAALPPGVNAQMVETIRSLTKDQILNLDEASRGQIIQIRVALGLEPVPSM